MERLRHGFMGCVRAEGSAVSLLKERLMHGLRVKSITQTRTSNTITEIIVIELQKHADIS